MSTGLAIGISVFLLAANAFFVGAEFALISARRSSIEPRAAEGGRAATITLKARRATTMILPVRRWTRVLLRPGASMCTSS